MTDPRTDRAALEQYTSYDEILESLRNLATSPHLLVATDYDGTLAPIVSDPMAAHPCRESLVALQSLANMPNTDVAIISGRGLSDLSKLIGTPDKIHVVGSHGSEFDAGFAASLSPELRRLKRRILDALRFAAGMGDGLYVEDKPASAAFHYRSADPGVAKAALAQIHAGPLEWPGVYIKHGKMVVELGVIPTDKGSALSALRHRVGATAVLFLGDDVTDEDAFATLRGPDIGVKVGPGTTSARFRVADTEFVSRVLAALCELRSEWLLGSHAVPIQDHSLLSDLRTIALVDPCGRVSWFCAPRLDAPALFAELVGGPTAGYFSIQATRNSTPEAQEYLEDSMILRTHWDGFTVTDFLDCSMQRPFQRAGRTDLVRMLEGRGRVRIEFAPRLDFGRSPTQVLPVEGGLVVTGSFEPVVLSAPGVAWEITREGIHQTARAEIDLDGELVLQLRFGTGSVNPGANSTHEIRDLSQHYWLRWSESLVLPPIEPELIKRSALVLKSLCYGPTGAISAAATTSLPEELGGIRNWDYRYCWLRDGAMSADALVRLGSMAEAMRFLDWVLGVVDDLPSPERLRPLYQVTGQDLGPEAEIADLAGYAGSRPVRIGNAAATQVQLDVFGPIVELIDLLSQRSAPLSMEHWRLTEAFAGAVAHRWREPDHGIWEIRGLPRHHVHSKVMCWLTIDRANKFANAFFGKPRPEWTELAQEIASDILQSGWKPGLGAFTSAYDGNDLDAAALFVGLSGMLEPDDARFVTTIDAVNRELRNGPTVYRYRGDDGLPGREGGFHLCTAWLIEALVLVGRHAEARELFAEFCTLVGPTGLMSEEYCPETGRALGNFPQAYSHLGLIRSALRLSSH